MTFVNGNNNYRLLEGNLIITDKQHHAQTGLVVILNRHLDEITSKKCINY